MNVSQIGLTTTSLPASTAAGVSSGSLGSSSIDRDRFLTLLVAQLRNQDPMSPLQPHEFAAQLAQFASVEQLTQLNAGVANQSADLQLVAMLGRTSLSASLLGRRVLAEGNQVQIPATGHASVTIDVPAAGGGATLKLFDAAGKEVATRSLGSQKGGRQTLELPADLPAGTYTYRVTIDGPGGSALPATTYISGTVDGVLFKNGEIVLKIGGLEISMDNLAEIAT